jgi:negative regulator of replication initiation
MLDEQWRKYMPTEAKMIEELTDDVRSALKLYEDTVVKFRSSVKNDIASAKSSAIAIAENVRRMGDVYHSTAAMLTTPEFEKAIANAERMATALKAISELNSHSITFAVLDKKGTP